MADSLNYQLVTDTLIEVFDQLGGTISNSEYCLVGTAAAVLHGVELPVGDIDILVRERAVVERFAEGLSAYSVLTPLSELEFQYFFECEIGEVAYEVSTVEVETDSLYRETVGEGPWIYSSLLECGPYEVRTIPLEMRLATELTRRRPDRIEPLISWLRIHDFDDDLLRNAMGASSLSNNQVTDVFKQLSTLAY